MDDSAWFLLSGLGGLFGGGGVVTLFSARSQKRKTDAEREDLVSETYHRVVGDLRDYLADLRDQLVNARSEAASAQAALASAQAELAQAQVRITQLVADASAERDALRRTITDREERVAELAGEVRRLHDEVETLRARVGDYERRASKLGRRASDRA